MTPARYARLRELFLAARELPAAAQATFVQQQTAGDDELAQALQQLLRNDAADADFLATPALGRDFALPDPDALHAQALPPGAPERFGTYRLLGVLGQGGMGIVYRALQQLPPREVALKVLKPGLADAQHLARFRFEVEALGRLQHVGIAAIHDAGTFDQGAGPQPYLAMELVDGRPLLEHADRAHLDRAARLRLVAQIADAIQHAHQRGIVHRDLKPANVLVDATGQPKVLDFGIATARDAGDVDVTRTTDARTLLGTLPYMSPEQLGAERRAVDTRTDVWSLGVLAFQLLTGRLPFVFDGLSPLQAARVVTEQTPPTPGDVDARLRGDVSTIVATAMAKDPERRYASAGEFAADVRRFLAHEPIAAKPPGTWTRIALFARRHRALVLGATSTVLALGIGLFATLRALDDARGAWSVAENRRVVAETQAQRADAVRGFVLGMLTRIDPRAGDGDNGADRLLAAAARELESRFAAHPDLEGELRLVLGGVLRMFGRYDEARRQVDASVALYTQQDGAAAPTTLGARCEQLELQLRRNDPAAVTTVQQLILDCERVLGADHERTLACRHAHVRCLLGTGRYADAAAAMPPLLAASARLPELPPELRLDLALTHADCLLANGDSQGAHDALVACVADSRSRLGDADPTTIDAMQSLALLLLGHGAVDRAAPLLEEVRRHHAARLPAAHPLVLQCEHNLGLLAVDQGRNDDAIAHLRRAAEGRLLVFGPGDMHRLTSLLSLANALGGAGRASEAAPVFEEVLQALGDGLPGKPWFLPTTRGYRAMNHARLGDTTRAITELEACIAELESLEGADSARPTRFRDVLKTIRQRERAPR